METKADKIRRTYLYNGKDVKPLIQLYIHVPHSRYISDTIHLELISTSGLQKCKMMI